MLGLSHYRLIEEIETLRAIILVLAVLGTFSTSAQADTLSVNRMMTMWRLYIVVKECQGLGVISRRDFAVLSRLTDAATKADPTSSQAGRVKAEKENEDILASGKAASGKLLTEECIGMRDFGKRSYLAGRPAW